MKAQLTMSLKYKFTITFFALAVWNSLAQDGISSWPVLDACNLAPGCREVRTATDTTMVTYNSRLVYVRDAAYPESYTVNTGNQRIHFTRLALSLYANTAAFNPYPEAYMVSLRCQIRYAARSGGAERTATARLRINYSPESGASFQYVDTYYLEEVIWAKITVDSFGASIPFVNLPEESPFFLRAEIVSEQYADPIPDNLLPSVAPAPPPRLSVSQNGGYIRVLLDPENRTASWAAYYDLEWVFVDGYGLPLEGIPQSSITPATTPSAPTDLRDRFRITGPVQVGRGDIVVRTNPGNNAPPTITFPNVPYDFRHNSTRVSIRQREYEIPLVFEKGLVIIRYRAVALYGNDFSQPRPGNWSKETTGEITLGGSNPLLSEGVVVIQGNLVHEQDRKNWQYIANYAENGLRKDVLSYFDGSLRDRQSITRLNTDGQHLVVGEKIYDHQGRPAISILPAPYKPNQEQEVRLNEDFDAPQGMSSSTANASPATQALVASTASSAPRSRKIKGRRRTTVAGGLAQLNSPSSANPQNSGITLMNWARPEITALGNISYSGSGNLAPIIQASPLIRALQYTLGNTNQDLNASILRNTQFRDWSQYFDFQNPTPRATTAQPPSREWLRLESYLTQNPALRFQERFNVNSQGQPYSWRDFDIRRETPPADCGAEALPPLVQPLGTQSGAGNYYSPENPDQQGLQAFVPDAKGYPFVQTEFMPDPGSRVRRVGAPGLTHQLGNGHDKRFAYGVPAQAELDRWFGNDAGKAEHYQRVVMTDENGQQYIQYINPKGQVVGSGLLGPAPENLQALSRADQSVTLNVTEESRPQEADGFLVWSRTVTLSQPGNIQLDYAFDPALLDTALCNRNLCLSCIYDLEVELRNSCGEYLWHMRATLGNLAEIANCRASNLRRDTLLTGLPPGDYHLSKRLRVNEAAVDAAVDQIMAANDCWRDNYAAPAQAPPCPAADDCIPCQYEFENITYPGMPISRVPFKRMPGNNPACARICFGPEDIPMPFDMNMYHRLVQDVSPGGQYGIIWTTRTISDGITIRVPANDLLSVFSFSNQLTLTDPGRTSPMGGMHYGKPVFPYRNADGSEAWVDVEGKIEGIDYYIGSLRTDASGRRLIRPNDIISLEWLDAVWQDAWGESLVPYHPEYLYWVWAQHLASSESHNRQMEETVTFPPQYLPTPDGDYPAELFNADPYFNLYPEDVTAMRTALNAASRPVSGITYSAYQVAFASVFCGSPYYRENPTELASCIGAGTEIRNRIQGLDLLTQAQVWEIFKQFYLKAKARLHDQRRDTLFTNLGLFNADYLGDPPCKSLVVVAEVFEVGEISAALAAAYRRSIPRFRRANCTPNLPIDLDGDGRQDAYLPADNYAAIESWGDMQRGNFDAECRQCGGGEGLLGLLNGLSQNNLLISNTPLVLPRGLDLPMPSDLAAALGSLQRTYEYKSSSAGNGELIISLIAGSNVTTIRLEPQGNEPGSQWLPGSPNTRNSLNWKKIRYFSCLKELKDKSKRPVRNVFYLEAYTDEGQKHIIHLHTTLPFSACTRPETPRYNFTLRRNDNTAFIEALIKYLFADPRRMRERRIELPEVISNLTDMPRINTINLSLSSVELLIEFRGSDCKIYVEVYDDSYDKDKQPRVTYNMPSVVAILPVYESTSPTSAFIVFMQDSDGRRFPLRGRIEKEDCLAVFDRVPGSPTRDCCLPILPVIRIPRYCDQQAVAYTRLDLANEQAIRAGEEIFERRAWRAWYLRRCQGNLDRLLIRYEAPVYQMTLFYYDQAGNRIRTVPPQGVRPLTDPQVAAVNRQENGPRVYPAHTMATTYRYNSLNQVVYRYAPDGGATRHAYDELGRVVLSQDAEQATRARAAYLRYDALGRLSESGFTNWEGPLPAAIAHRNFLERLRNQEEVFTTHYDRAAFADPALQGRFSGGQQHLRGRIASVSYRPGVSSAFQHATHYSYDRMGNMRELVQDFASLTTFFPSLAEHRYKQLRYDYDLITGNVNRMIYQPGFADQFVHWYDYDADNRVAAIYTAADPRTPVSLREREARYEYYRHGPQARITLGQDMVQGLDYIYTIHGWLKGINCPLPNPATDPGQDGRLSATAPDAYGYTLGYYAEDYRPIGLSRAGIDNEPVNFFRPDNGPLAALNTASPSLYNGNIRYTIHGNQGLSPGFQATAYRYDQIQRLVQSRVWQPPTTDPGFAGQGLPFALPATNYAALTQSDRWAMDLSYDANGNILTLNRTDDQGAPMDALVYHYPDPANNRLGHITDGAGRRLPASHPSPDLAGHTPGNYAYDAKGRLTQDRAEGNLRLEWSGTDKLKRLTKDGQELEFYYDALGRRTLKYNRSAGTATYYVRDARGEVLSTYTAAATGLRWDYLPIIGATRIGSFTPGLTLPAGNRPVQPDRSAGWRGRRAYELISQTGDVLTLLSDRRLPNTTGAGARAEFLEAHDYYPFGMPQPDRSLTAPEQLQSTASMRYPFGFQGMEMDSDYKGEGGAYTTEFRQYDARVGRWLSVDPKIDKYADLSPYLSFNNSPNLIIDPNGDDPPAAGSRTRRARQPRGRVILPQQSDIERESRWRFYSDESTSASITFSIPERLIIETNPEESQEEQRPSSETSRQSIVQGRIDPFIEGNAQLMESMESMSIVLEGTATAVDFSLSLLLALDPVPGDEVATATFAASRLRQWLPRLHRTLGESSANTLLGRITSSAMRSRLRGAVTATMRQLLQRTPGVYSRGYLALEFGENFIRGRLTSGLDEAGINLFIGYYQLLTGDYSTATEQRLRTTREFLIRVRDGTQLSGGSSSSD